MTVEIRPITDDEYQSWIEAVEAAFGADTHEGDVDRWRRTTETRRVLAAVEGERIVAGAAAFSFDLTVPGSRQLRAAGVTMVGVMPTHRRQGILRRMMARQLADARAEGESVAILWASEGLIYQRFGYGLASLNGAIDIERAKAAFRADQGRVGTMRLVDANAAIGLLPQVYDRAARAIPGFVGRDRDWWETRSLADPEHWRDGASRKFFAVHERDGEPAGYAIYRIKEDWNERGPRSELRLHELVAVDVEAERQLWEFIFGVDLVHRVVRWVGPPQPALLLQLAQPELLGARLSAGLWLRILDVPGALAGRGYEQDGQLVINVSDEFMPDLAGRWRLSVRAGKAAAEPTDDPADIELETNDLAALYLGAFSFADLAQAGRTRELSAGAAVMADRLFASSIRPWCPQIF
ncbi:MAG TPA: GNAT family N-acetyltransferase [Candidatus Limnocylindrales bacterium]|nr:GNAT family N-acetyltransferase [Candidatus Limnocylindrales bacterium]